VGANEPATPAIFVLKSIAPMGRTYAFCIIVSAWVGLAKKHQLNRHPFKTMPFAVSAFGRHYSA
jgi:hypothetical protein